MKPVAFCHVRKTGGTTLHSIFQSVVGIDQVSAGHGSEQYANALRRWAHVTVISQHMWFAPGEILNPGRFNLTVLRSPVDRVVSNYYYVRAQESVFNPDALERRVSLSDFVAYQSDYARGEVENHQVKLFAPITLGSEGFSTSDEKLLSAAKDALDQFDLVGVTERLEETVDLISYLTGMKTVPIVARERSTESRPPRSEIPSDVLRQIRSKNTLDEELHDYATRRFRKLARRCVVNLIDLEQARPEHASSARVLQDRQSTSSALSESGLWNDSRDSSKRMERFGSQAIRIESVQLHGDVSLGAPDFISGEYLTIKVKCRSAIAASDVTVGIHIQDSDGRLMYGTNTWHLGRSITVTEDALFSVAFRFQIAFGTGRYRLGVTIHTGNSHLERCFDWYDNCAFFGVMGVSGFHFDGLVSLVPSVSVTAFSGGALLAEGSQKRGGFISLGYQNRPIEKPEGTVRATAQALDIRAGEVFAVEVDLENASDAPWEELGRRCAKLCYRWFREDGTPLVEEGERNNIGGDLHPGETRRVWVTVKSPGRYVGQATLRVTLLQEHVAWFDQRGKLYCDLPVRIRSGSEEAGLTVRPN